MDASDADLLAQLEDDVLSVAPIADILRKCIVLGGRANSQELRDWATKELRGYSLDESLPRYRIVQAALCCDAILSDTLIREHRLDPRAIPALAEAGMGEDFPVRYGVGEVHALANQAREAGGHVRISLPMTADVAQAIDKVSGQPWQTTAVYWNVGAASLEGVVDQVRTSTAQLITELRGSSKSSRGLPSPAAAAQALNIAVHGKGRVVVHSAQTSGSGQSRVGDSPTESPFWTRGRKIGAAVVGLAGIASAVFGWYQAFH